MSGVRVDDDVRYVVKNVVRDDGLGTEQVEGVLAGRQVRAATRDDLASFGIIGVLTRRHMTPCVLVEGRPRDDGSPVGGGGGVGCAVTRLLRSTRRLVQKERWEL